MEGCCTAGYKIRGKIEKNKFRFKLIVLTGICQKISWSGIIQEDYGRIQNNKIRYFCSVELEIEN